MAFREILDECGLTIEGGELIKVRNCPNNLGVTPEIALLVHLVFCFAPGCLDAVRAELSRTRAPVVPDPAIDIALEYAVKRYMRLSAEALKGDNAKLALDMATIACRVDDVRNILANSERIRAEEAEKK